MSTNVTTQIFNRWDINAFETAKSNVFLDGRTTCEIDAFDGIYFYIITPEGKMYKGFVEVII